GQVTLHVAGTVGDTGYIVNSFAFLNVSTSPNNNDNQAMTLCAESCFDADYSYMTVPYMSEDEPRQIGLTYNSNRIAVRPFIAADVSMLPNGPAALQLWLQAKVNWGSGWTTVVFMNGDSTLHFA